MEPDPDPGQHLNYRCSAWRFTVEKFDATFKNASLKCSSASHPRVCILLLFLSRGVESPLFWCSCQPTHRQFIKTHQYSSKAKNKANTRDFKLRFDFSKRENSKELTKERGQNACG